MSLTANRAHSPPNVLEVRAHALYIGRVPLRILASPRTGAKVLHLCKYDIEACHEDNWEQAMCLSGRSSIKTSFHSKLILKAANIKALESHNHCVIA